MLTQQQHGGVPSRCPDNRNITHCLVSLPFSDPKPYFTRTLDETPHRLPHSYEDWNLDHCLYYYHLEGGRRGPVVVQSEWLYESIKAKRVLDVEDSWGGWRIRCVGLSPLYEAD